MAKEKFKRRLLYVGPVSSFSITGVKKTDAGKILTDETQPLITGQTYDGLPIDHPVIKNLVAQKLLIEQSDDPAVAPSKTVVSDSGTAKSSGATPQTPKPTSVKPTK